MANLQGINPMLALLSLILLPYVIFNLLRFLKRAYLDPIRITKSMEAQGIRGPPYMFFHGSTSEANKLMEKSMNKPPMELSHNILPKVQPHFHSWIKLYGRNVLTWYGSTPRLVVGEAELVKEILSDREGGFPKYEPPEFMKKLLGYGLVTSNGQKWIRQRKLATHAFRSESLKGMIPAIIASVEVMLQKWVKFEGKEIDLFKEFCILTSEIISRTAFGSSYIEGKNIFIKIDELTAICARNFQAIRLPFFRKFVPHQDDMEAEKIEQVIRKSIMKLIIEQMTMVINESMRLYPPVLNIFRTVAKDCKVGNVVLPKGMQIQISPLVIHHDHNTWGDDSDLFLPDRFTATANGGAAFLPFGVGPRLCVGQGLAILEAKLALSMIMQRHYFTLSPAYVHSPVSRLSCRPQHGIQVVLQRL